MTAGTSITGLEIRSIDYVPLSERHGRLWHLGPLWFMGNAQIATLAVGIYGVTSGGNFIWSLIAVVAGCLFGSFFMAFHSAQGPQLGLPQMIQSRPQFGYVGAIVVWLFALLNYAGFNVFNTILAGSAVQQATHTSGKASYYLVTLLAVLVALLGYDWIHRMEQWLTAAFVVIFGVFTVGAALTVHLPAGSFDLAHFTLTPFLVEFGVAAGYQISWAVYVSDYSRYLPPSVTVRGTFLWTYWGSALGAIWLMGLGSLLAAAAGKNFDPVGSILVAGNGIVSGFGPFLLWFSVLGLASVTALNMYGGSLTLISAIDSFKQVRPTRTVRVVTVALITVTSLVFALISSQSFLSSFENFLLLLLYLFIPWTAVNLVDYYIVRRGHYAIGEIFNPQGIYGRWGWRGILAYLVGFAAMTPFFSTGLYTGPVASSLNGADLSIFVGLPVSAVLYYLLARSLDVESERRLAERTQVEVERLAQHHDRPVDTAIP